MIPISDRDISRAFGAEWCKNQKEKGTEEFFLYRKYEGVEKKWFLLDQNNRIVRRIRSNVKLGMILGCDEQVDQNYDNWIQIFNTTKGGL